MVEEFSFDEGIHRGEWQQIPSYIQYQGGWDQATSQAQYNETRVSPGTYYWTLHGRTRSYSGPHYTPNLPHNATASDDTAAMTAAVNEAFVTPRNGDESGSGYAGRIFSASIVGHVGTNSWPFGDGDPHQFIFGAYVGSQYKMLKPVFDFPRIPQFPPYAIETEWDSKEWAIEDVEISWDIPVECSSSASGGVTLSAHVQFLMSVDPADAANAQDNTTYDPDTSAVTGPMAPDHRMPILLDEVTVGCTANTRGVGRITGSRVLSSGERAALGEGKITFEMTVVSAEVSIYGDEWTSPPGSWSAGQYLEVAVDGAYGSGDYDDGSGVGVQHNYIRAKCLLRPPKFRYIFAEPGGGDGLESKPAVENDPGTVYAVMGGRGNNYGYIVKWDGSEFTLVNPHDKWGRWPGLMALLPNGDLYVADGGSDYNSYDSQLGYRINADLDDYRPSPVAHWKANHTVPGTNDQETTWWDPPINGHLIYRPESGNLWLSVQLEHQKPIPVDPPHFHGYRNTVTGVITDTIPYEYYAYSWEEFDLDGHDIRSRADIYRLDQNNRDLEFAAYMDGWFYRWAGSAVDRFNPSTGQFQWAWTNWYATPMMGASDGKLGILFYDNQTRNQYIRLIHVDEVDWHDATYTYDYTNFPPAMDSSKWTDKLFWAGWDVIPGYAYNENDSIIVGSTVYYVSDQLDSPDWNNPAAPGWAGIVAYDLDSQEWSVAVWYPNEINGVELDEITDIVFAPGGGFIPAPVARLTDRNDGQGPLGGPPRLDVPPASEQGRFRVGGYY